MKINGEEYAWEDIQVAMSGKVIEGIQGISYTVKRNHTNIYGRGNKPIAGGRGKKEYDGSITLLQSEVEALQLTLPRGKDITDIKPFDIVVAFAPEGGKITTDIIKYARFAELTKAFKNEDGNMVCELPLVVGDINYNV